MTSHLDIFLTRTISINDEKVTEETITVYLRGTAIDGAYNKCTNKETQYVMRLREHMLLFNVDGEPGT